jgi:hypothetical protein
VFPDGPASRPSDPARPTRSSPGSPPTSRRLHTRWGPRRRRCPASEHFPQPDTGKPRKRHGRQYLRQHESRDRGGRSRRPRIRQKQKQLDDLTRVLKRPDSTNFQQSRKTPRTGTVHRQGQPSALGYADALWSAASTARAAQRPGMPLTPPPRRAPAPASHTLAAAVSTPQRPTSVSASANGHERSR